MQTIPRPPPILLENAPSAENRKTSSKPISLLGMVHQRSTGTLAQKAPSEPRCGNPRSNLGVSHDTTQPSISLSNSLITAFQEQQMCTRSLQKLQKLLAQCGPVPKTGSTKHEELQQSIHIAEVDLAYTQYFPTEDKEYQHLFPPGVSGFKNMRMPRPPLWNFVEACMKDGRLEEFKHGELDKELAAKGLALQPRILTSENLRLATTHKKRQQPVSHEHTTEDLPPSKDDHQRFYVKLPPNPQLGSRNHNESDENDDCVLLNFETNEQESGEWSETAPMAEENRESHLMSGSQQRSYHSPNRVVQMEEDRQEWARSVPGRRDASNEVDAMVTYADADQAMRLPEQSNPQFQSTTVESSQPKTLADLGDEDLDAQLRYFYITHDPHDLDLRSIPIRCLVCVRAGHMAQDCEALTCADCGSYNDHFVPFCPQKMRCFRCRSQGHDAANCPSKLKLTASDIVCDLCQNRGHTEYECELLWRTSGPPTPLDKSDRRWKYIYCYECGRPQHLGNDCPVRKPGKRMGTGTWSLSGNTMLNQPRNQSKNGLAIRGRAQQQQPPEPISIDSDSDEEVTFVRPKVPAPTNRGSIHIAPPSQSNTQDARRNPMSDPYPGPQQLGYGNNSPQHVGDLDAYRQWSSAQRGFYNASNEPYLHRGHPGTRSRPNPNYQPPRPPGPPPPAKYSLRSQPERVREETYRPMPSAGQNAWRQHRI